MSEDFERAVMILAGLGHPTAISSSMEAFMFLADWPTSRRDPSHQFVMETCLASVRSDVDAGLARALFASWADDMGILAPDAPATAARERLSTAEFPRAVAA